MWLLEKHKLRFTYKPGTFGMYERRVPLKEVQENLKNLKINSSSKKKTDKTSYEQQKQVTPRKLCRKESLSNNKTKIRNSEVKPITETNKPKESHNEDYNEILHLNLALNEKQKEINELKNLINRDNFQKSVIKARSFIKPAPEKQKSYNSSNYLFSKPYYPVRFAVPNEMDRQKEVDSYSQISGSPYNGSRTGSLKTESSVATTNISQVRKNHIFFREVMIPYIQNTINGFQSSYIFYEEANQINFKFKEILELNFDDDHKVNLLSEILDNLTYLQIQQISFLNKELQIKKISKELDYIYKAFSKNDKYKFSQEKLSDLKNKFLDILGKYFDYHGTLDETAEHINMEETDLEFSTLKSRLPPWKSQEWSEQASDRPWLKPGIAKNENRKQQQYIDPSLYQSNSPNRWGKVNQNNNQNMMEFVPIGYTEKLLKTRNNQRYYPNNMESLISPINRVNKDDQESPLNKFLNEKNNR